MAITTDTRFNQVKTHMLNYISQNNLKRNDQLPSEASIAKDLGVSRNTLREAYVTLENEGVIVRRHGIGTFVAQPPYIQDSLNEFSPFAQIIQAVGYTPDFRTLLTEIIEAPPEVSDVLKLKSNTSVRYIERIVLADQKPVIYVEDYLPSEIDLQITGWDTFKGNLVEVLTKTLNTPLHQIQSYIRAQALPAAISEYFELPVGTPILGVRSTIYTLDNQAVTYSKLCFNSEIIELNIVRMIR